MSKLLSAGVFLLCVSALCLGQTSSARMLIEHVTINKTHIVFSYAGDIWAVERAGGDARRLTETPADEGFPVFSPDGSRLAFSRQIGGDWDVFIMPAAGGEARRLTYMPEHDLVMNWTPDGRSILFRSHRDEETQFRLYTIAVNGVFPSPLPLPQGFTGSYSSDGSRIAYTPKPSPGEWRYYRGGAVTPVWIADLATGAVEKLPHGNYNDRQPMWIGNKIYFVSDRTGHANLFVYDLSTKQTRQLTNYNKHGIRAASSGGGAIAYIHEGRIHTYDLASGGEKTVGVTCPVNASQMKSRSVSAAQYIQSAAMDAKGEQVVIGARGEVFSLDPKTGDARNLTGTSAVAERDGTPSPDGQSVAYFSDESGEYQLHVRARAGAVKKISVEQRPSFYRELTWSPDSRRIAFTDKRLALWVADVDASAARRIDSSTYSYQEEWVPKWSPDGRWLAYSKHHANRARTVYVYDVEGAKTHQITDGRTHTESPVFDASGKYLYFLSSPNAGTSEFGWGVLNGEIVRPLVRRTVHAIVLEEGAQSPLFPNGQPNPEVKPGERVNSREDRFRPHSRARNQSASGSARLRHALCGATGGPIRHGVGVAFASRLRQRPVAGDLSL